MAADPVTAIFNFLTVIAPPIIDMIEKRKIVPKTALQIATDIVRGINILHGETGNEPFEPHMRHELAHEAIRIEMCKRGMEPNTADVNWFLEQAVQMVRIEVMGPDAPIAAKLPTSDIEEYQITVIGNVQ